MITCERCGKQFAAGFARCQHCGMPVSSFGKDKMDAQEQSELPAWLESLRANERPDVSANPQQSFSPADLIDEDDLPGWMRADPAFNMQDSSKHPAIRPASQSAPNTDAGGIRSGGFSASELIDPSSLPSWMQPNGSSAAANPTGASTGRAFAQGNVPQSASGEGLNPETPSHLLSAGSLIDRQSLPPWMSEQANLPGQQINQTPWQGAAVQQPSPGNSNGGQQSGLAASSLLDMNALPEWLRDGQQGQGQARPSGQLPQLQGGNLTAGSLIDMNSLPTWLREVDKRPQAPTGARIPTPYAVPGRFESSRVPSRPRVELTSPEQSEVAANVFSSMLGVASTAPYYPASGMNTGSQPIIQNAPVQPSGSLFASQAMPQVMSPSAFGGDSGIQPTPAAQNGYAGGYQNSQNLYGVNSSNNQGQLMSQGMPPAQYPGLNGQGGPFNARQEAPANQTGAKPGKRSFFDTIREWFHL